LDSRFGGTLKGNAAPWNAAGRLPGPSTRRLGQIVNDSRKRIANVLNRRRPFAARPAADSGLASQADRTSPSMT